MCQVKSVRKHRCSANVVLNSFHIAENKIVVSRHLEDWLHGIAPAAQGKHQMERGTAFEVIFCGCLVIRPINREKRLATSLRRAQGLSASYNRNEGLHLLSAEDESLLDGWNALLLFDALLYPRHLRRKPFFSKMSLQSSPDVGIELRLDLSKTVDG